MSHRENKSHRATTGTRIFNAKTSRLRKPIQETHIERCQSPKFVSPRRKLLRDGPLTNRRPSTDHSLEDDDSVKDARAFSKRMALDDDYVCPHHADSIVVLYCATCSEMVCAKCVSHGAACTSGLHKDHAYLDVQEAFELKKVNLSTFTLGGTINSSHRMSLRNCWRNTETNSTARRDAGSICSPSFSAKRYGIILLCNTVTVC
jgi:hypothetical protein